jgi:hypothetical protein
MKNGSKRTLRAPIRTSAVTRTLEPVDAEPHASRAELSKRAKNL